MLFILRGRSRNTIRLIYHPPSRSYAQSPIPKLSEKIQAYPFLLDINVAQVYARELIANLLHKPGIVKKIKTLLGLSFGRHYIQPKTRAALYFPAWIVDSETKVKLDDSTGLPIPIYMDQSYFPGCISGPISRVTLTPIKPNDHPLFDVEQAVTQGVNTPDSFIPFTITPLSMPSFLRSYLKNDLRYVRSNWMTAYPLYIPIYVFGFYHGTRLTTSDEITNDQAIFVIVPAYTPEVGLGFMVAKNQRIGLYDANMSRTYQSSVNGIKQEPFSWDQTFHDNVRKATINWTRSDDHLIAFENYCKEKGHFNHINWDDLRIRKFVKEEIDKNNRYLERCFYVSQWERLTKAPRKEEDARMVQELLQLPENKQQAKVPKVAHVSHSVGSSTAWFKYERSMISPTTEMTLERTRQNLINDKPDWMVEWERQRRRKGLETWF